MVPVVPVVLDVTEAGGAFERRAPELASERALDEQRETHGVE